MSSKNSHVFLQVLPVKISNGNKSLTVNALFDSGSDSTLLVQNVGSHLNVDGKEHSITFSNAISQKVKSQIKISKFSFVVKVASYEN